MSAAPSTPLTFGLGKDGAPNALFDQLGRVVCSFPTDRTHDTRRGSPSTPETILANARLFAAAAKLIAALERAEGELDQVARFSDLPAYARTAFAITVAQARAAIADAKGGAR